VLSFLRRRSGEDAGYSLVELLVVMLMLSIIGGFVTTSVVTGIRTTRATEARTYALTDIQRGLERVGRELRAANPIELDGAGDFADSLGATVVRDGHRVRYQYYLEEQPDGSTSLLEDVQRTNLGNGATSGQNGLFIADIANLDTGTPLFTYYGTDDVTRELEEINCASLTEDECRQAHQAATQVELTLEKYVEGQDMIVVKTVVNVRNTRLG
jgi:prepilin-type N-terminal cleavage/methylation domain-containing protein